LEEVRFRELAKVGYILVWRLLLLQGIQVLWFHLFLGSMAERLLNFNEPLDVPLLETVLQVVYTSGDANEVGRRS
jgi:exportin-1